MTVGVRRAALGVLALLALAGCAAGDGGGADGSLSGELSRSHGVVAPPPTGDEGIAAPTPELGPQSMPVVPPPGTPGGQPGAIPK